MHSAAALSLRHPRAVLAGWIVAVAILAILGLRVEDRLTQSILVVSGTESERAIALAREEFGQSVTTPILLEGPAAEIERQGPALVNELGARDDLRVLSPWDRVKGADQLRPRPDAAMIVAAIDRPYREAFDEIAPQLRERIEATIEPPLEARVTGMAAIGNGLKDESYAAARRAELIAIPILFVILLAVFRSPIAAAIPALTGLSTVGASLGLIWVIASFWQIDPIATSLASMMGLALGVDYALLIVSRFREELAAGSEPASAAVTASATAGRTVAFAGGALVAAMLVALVLSPGDLLLSAGVGVISSTLLSMGAGMLAMPAVLVIVGERIDLWRFGGRSTHRRWVAALERLLKRPGVAAAVLIAPLLLLAGPALALETGPPDVRQLPSDSAARQDFEAVRDVMGPGWAAPFDVIVAAPEGSITDPNRLRTLERWERKVARWPGVAYVIGPSRVAEQTEDLARADRRLAQGEKGLKRLESGLGEASAGMAQLREGLAEATEASRAISSGAGTAAEETQRLDAALAAGAVGAGRISSALSQAAAGAERVSTGTERALAGSRRLKSGLETARERVAGELAPGAERLAGGLDAGAEDLGRLREPAATAERQSDRAFDALQRMTIGRADPRYRDALAAAGRAYGAISGRDPVTGAQLDPRYDGMATELRRGQRRLTAAAAGARRLAAGIERLEGGLVRLREGAGHLSRGLGRLAIGTARLERGLERLAAATAGFGDVVDRLETGAGELIAGLGRLDAGTGELADRLEGGHGRSGDLERGLERLEAGAARIHSGVASASGKQMRRSPGLFDSGYFVLAAIDGAPPETREQASFAVNVERGGEAGSVTVVPSSAPNEPQTARLQDRLSAAADRLADDTGTETAVGGPAAQLADYDEATSARLVVLILALAAVTYLLLVPIFRSLVLPAIAVALNLATVAAAFGVLALAFEGESPLLGGPGYVDAVAISAIYTVIFGLTIDYEVFLITRMREGWLRTSNTSEAIAYGLERTASVVTGAAAIMTGVFLAFALTEVANTRQFGVGLAVAVALDATVVRLVLLPALMRLAGDRCWWMPAWLERRLPRLAIE